MAFPLWPTRIAAPAVCPSCAGSVWLPALKAYRYAGAAREHVGDLCECAACGCRCTLLRDGGLVRLGRVAQAAPVAASGGDAGGHGTGRPGWLDPDMVTLDTPAGP